jgi:sialic acid synthase SpsE
MLTSIRHVEAALGDGIKLPVADELANRPLARRSVVAARAIRAGEVFCVDDLACKRPGQGISPLELWNIAGRRAARDYQPDDPIEP